MVRIAEETRNVDQKLSKESLAFLRVGLDILQVFVRIGEIEHLNPALYPTH